MQVHVITFVVNVQDIVKGSVTWELGWLKPPFPHPSHSQISDVGGVKRKVWPLVKKIFLYPAPGLQDPDPYC